MTIPPVDTSGELSKANAMLTRFDKQIRTLPPGWQKWVLDSLVARLAPKTDASLKPGADAK